jgi:hypothetical protein
MFNVIEATFNGQEKEEEDWKTQLSRGDFVLFEQFENSDVKKFSRIYRKVFLSRVKEAIALKANLD